MACNDLKLKIDGVDRTSLLIHETLTVSQTNDGLNSTCTFDMLDQAVIREGVWTVGLTHITDDGHVITGYATFFPQTKVDICITNAAETLIYFAGILSRVHATHLGQIEVMPGYVEPETQVLRCECADYNQVLEEMVIDDFREYGGLTDEELIDAVFDEFVAPFDDPYNIDYATFVTAVPHAFDIITFDSITVRQFMDTLCGITGAVWYVDYSRKLHYAADEAALVPPWHLSDNPDDATSFRYFDDITKEKDATNLVNMVFVVCATDLLPVSLWFIDQDSIDKYGPHRAIVRDTSLFDIDDIEDKGNSTLEKFKDPIVTYVLRTYKGTPGGDDGIDPATPIIRAGQHIRVVCAFYDLDETFKINSLIITFPVDGTPVYEITCGGLDSSASGSATRSTLDQIHVPNVTPSSLPIAARGWGHDLEFTAPDEDTVAWTIGTVTTADGQEFDIAPAADTGDMAALTYVYLDAAITLGAWPPQYPLQHSVNPEDSIGLNKILIAVCAPDTAAVPTEAMYQVFGGGAGVTAFLHADNIAANCITANEIYGNTLSVIAADMGVLTAGQIRMIGAAGSLVLASGGILLYDGDDPDVDNVRLHLNTADGKFTFQSAVAGNPRIEIDNTEIVGYDAADVKQFYLQAADGKAYFGAGAGIMDKDGLRLIGSGGAGNPRKLRFIDNSAGEKFLGTVMADWPGGAGIATTWLVSSRQAGDPWPANNVVVLAAIDTIAGTDVRLYVHSGGVVSLGGSTYFSTNADARIGGGLYVGQTGVDPPVDQIHCDGDARVGKGLMVGSTANDPPDDNLCFETTNNRIRMVGAKLVFDVGGGTRLYMDANGLDIPGQIRTDGVNWWELKDWHATTGAIACNGYVDVIIAGAPRRLMTRL